MVLMGKPEEIYGFAVPIDLHRFPLASQKNITKLSFDFISA